MTHLAEKITANIESIPNTIAFLGAGMGINGGMKSWGDSMSEVLEECKRLQRNAAELRFFELLVEEKNYAKFMDEVYDRLGDVKYMNIVQKVFRRECHPTIEHEYWSLLWFEKRSLKTCRRLRGMFDEQWMSTPDWKPMD